MPLSRCAGDRPPEAGLGESVALGRGLPPGFAVEVVPLDPEIAGLVQCASDLVIGSLTGVDEDADCAFGAGTRTLDMES